MGIKGLLPSLQSITRHVDLEKYRGLTVAVDAMCWLHKGIFTGNVSALAKYQLMNVVDADGEKKSEQSGLINDTIFASTVKRLDFDQFTSRRNRMDAMITQTLNTDAIEAMSKCISYVIRHAIQLQTRNGLDIILVIDGDSLPIKHKVNEKRRLDREEAFKQGLKAEKKGDNRQARKFFSRACSISYEMRYELIRQCKQSRIRFIVAPYEADAQMAKLAHSSDVDLVISEDSDLLVYGCPRVLFKVDFKTGKGEEIQLMRDLAMNDPLPFRHWNHDMFVYMCILAGCDYCEGIPGIGLQKAHKLVRINRKPKKILNALQDDGKLPEGFEESFWNAYRTFRHQRVFCLQKRTIECLFEVREGSNESKSEEWNFLGPSIESSIGIGISEGKLHPKEKISWDVVQASINQKHQSMIMNFAMDSNCNKERIRANVSSKKKVTNISGETIRPKVSRRKNITCTSGTPQQRKRLTIDRSPIEKAKMEKLDPSDKNLFAFFKSKRRKEPKRPPLEVIMLDQNSNTENIHHNIVTRRKSSELSKMLIQPIPSNYHDYSSDLVSGCFKPIAEPVDAKSKNKRRYGVSKAIRELKQKLSLKKSKNKENMGYDKNRKNQDDSIDSLHQANHAEITQSADGIYDDSQVLKQFDDMADITLPLQYKDLDNLQDTLPDPSLNSEIRVSSQLHFPVTENDCTFDQNDGFSHQAVQLPLSKNILGANDRQSTAPSFGTDSLTYDGKNHESQSFSANTKYNPMIPHDPMTCQIDDGWVHDVLCRKEIHHIDEKLEIPPNDNYNLTREAHNYFNEKLEYFTNL